ncbi:MAG: prepilin peptidase [Proteobacteria bacterium]|nr:prepilin peptidase [Desulfobacula sp.]MBU3951469.1 prepilin peptidase [Pseudomonadota bacterium]MBU4130740.1 prepilin peptidase [Pseudomonadota bacterium]
MLNNTITLTLLLFAFGACIGSFLNVCIFRIPEKLSIVFPGSFCPICKKEIPFYCNIPILSYLFLMGRCKHCKSRISFRYPMVELLAGVFTVLLFVKFGLTAQLFFWMCFVYVLIVISLIDLDHQIIPDRISIPGILIFSSSAVFIPEMSAVTVLAGIISGGGILYAIAFVYLKFRKKEGMGGGDIKLLAMIGAATGLKGVLFTLFAGSFMGTFAGIAAMVLTRGCHGQLKIPFGPYLSLGTILYIFFGEGIIQWYLLTITGY